MLLRRCALAVGVVVALSPAAQADPVNIITSGSYHLSFGTDIGFRFVGTDFDFGGIAVGDLDPLLVACRPCAPGTSVDFTTTLEALLDLTNTPAILEGRSFPQETLFFNGPLTLHPGAVTAPDPPPNDQAIRRVPFVASGFLTAFDKRSGQGSLSFPARSATRDGNDYLLQRGELWLGGKYCPL